MKKNTIFLINLLVLLVWSCQNPTNNLQYNATLFEQVVYPNQVFEPITIKKVGLVDTLNFDSCTPVLNLKNNKNIKKYFFKNRFFTHQYYYGSLAISNKNLHFVAFEQSENDMVFSKTVYALLPNSSAKNNVAVKVFETELDNPQRCISYIYKEYIILIKNYNSYADIINKGATNKSIINYAVVKITDDGRLQLLGSNQSQKVYQLFFK
ncbi:hypothetical protein FLBR109950_03495 [Flavobacterium branchiophilum]|uniref:Hypothetical lipoprotein n=1 Tax=Flavobacterium branchiophilum (strain FL-15) TaxID=1034807 RepID=G2Z2N5_FLABF|nr:hypothetical protein [Flavobacterium branchiophilum]CCB70208.1 Hypothetical lipoprotein precursor [Flavobacterium branchiophilum FL-15]